MFSGFVRLLLLQFQSFLSAQDLFLCLLLLQFHSFLPVQLFFLLLFLLQFQPFILLRFLFLFLFAVAEYYAVRWFDDGNAVVTLDVVKRAGANIIAAGGGN